MKAHELIGKYVTRTAPAVYPHGTMDNSYIGDILQIVSADEELIAYKHVSCPIFGDKISFLGKMWCDDNWKDASKFYTVEEAQPIHDKSPSFVARIRSLFIR